MHTQLRSVSAPRPKLRAPSDVFPSSDAARVQSFAAAPWSGVAWRDLRRCNSLELLAARRGQSVAAQHGRARALCGEADSRSAHPAVELRSSLSCAAGARARAGKAHPWRRSLRPPAGRSRCRPQARHILARLPRRCRGPSELVWRTAASTAARQAVRIAERRGEARRKRRREVAAAGSV